MRGRDLSDPLSEPDKEFMDVIKGRPTAGLTCDPNERKYRDREALDPEVERIFEICHGEICHGGRHCFNQCPSLQELFNAVDDQHGDVRPITGPEAERVIDTATRARSVMCARTHEPDGFPTRITQEPHATS